jgi:hypothetical protein
MHWAWWVITPWNRLWITFRVYYFYRSAFPVTTTIFTHETSIPCIIEDYWSSYTRFCTEWVRLNILWSVEGCAIWTKWRKLESKLSLSTSVRKRCPRKKIHKDFMDTLRKESSLLPLALWKDELLNVRRAGRALEMMSGLGGQKRPPTMKLPKLCTIWSCST